MMFTKLLVQHHSIYSAEVKLGKTDRVDQRQPHDDILAAMCGGMGEAVLRGNAQKFVLE